MLKVGYGAMVLESLLAIIALCVAGAAAAADGTPAAGTPFQVFSLYPCTSRPNFLISATSFVLNISFATEAS